MDELQNSQFNETHKNAMPFLIKESVLHLKALYFGGEGGEMTDH